MVFSLTGDRPQLEAESAITRDHVVPASVFHGPDDTTDPMASWEYPSGACGVHFLARLPGRRIGSSWGFMSLRS